MKHIGEISAQIQEKIAGAAVLYDAQRQESIERYGWADDCECDYCGDTGIDPERKQICNCRVGRAKDTERRLLQEWPKIAPWRFQNFRLDTHPNKKAVASVRDWMANGYTNHTNLMLVGPVGSGKTGLAIGAMYDIYMTDKYCIFDTFSGFLDRLRPRDTPALDQLEMEDLTNCALLVIDDLGTQKMTDWVAERLYVIINDRYQNGRPFIITTNMTKNELKDSLGERIMSRINSSTTTVAVLGRDLREAGAA